MNQLKRAVFIGASAGGITAILKLLNFLPPDYPLPIIITQHLPKDSQVQMSSLFTRNRDNRVFEAEDKMPIETHHVYLAPPDYHLLVEPDFTLSLSQDEPENFSRPSIDVLFQSAAVAFAMRTIGILLSGSNDDGAKGLFAIQQAGGKTMIQDPRDAEFSAMPRAALALIQPDFIGNLDAIAKELITGVEDLR